jgi:hypothetical protein
MESIQTRPAVGRVDEWKERCVRFLCKKTDRKHLPFAVPK